MVLIAKLCPAVNWKLYCLNFGQNSKEKKNFMINQDSNPDPIDYEPTVLPTELLRHVLWNAKIWLYKRRCNFQWILHFCKFHYDCVVWQTCFDWNMKEHILTVNYNLILALPNLAKNFFPLWEVLKSKIFTNKME